MCLLVAKLVHYKVISILITFTLLSGFLSMFIDSITVMLFLATVTVEIARLLKFDPVPVIIAEIFASNTGVAPPRRETRLTSLLVHLWATHSWTLWLTPA